MTEMLAFEAGVPSPYQPCVVLVLQEDNEDEMDIFGTFTTEADAHQFERDIKTSPYKVQTVTLPVTTPDEFHKHLMRLANESGMMDKPADVPVIHSITNLQEN